jgi:hypothetical protein
LNVLYVHSDNAAQHFKSSKTLHWFTKQLGGMGFHSILYDFGPPGHGKGVWDGLGGELKQWLRRRINSAQADSSKITSKSGAVEKAIDCYEMWSNYFELGTNGAAWRQSQKDNKKPMSAMHFH